jgi:hypothetical protein
MVKMACALSQPLTVSLSVPADGANSAKTLGLSLAFGEGRGGGRYDSE